MYGETAPFTRPFVIAERPFTSVGLGFMLRTMRFWLLAPSLLAVVGSSKAVFGQPAKSPTAVEACIASFSDAQIQQKRGHLVDAAKVYSECAAVTCPTQIREDCARKRDEVERALPTVVFVVRDANGKDLEAQVTVDNALFDSSSGRARPIDPGPHVIAYGPPGVARREEKVTIAEGEKSRTIVLAWTGEVPPRATPTKPAETSSTSTEDRAPARRSLVGPIVLGTMGAVALVATVGIYAISKNEEEKGDELKAIADEERKSGSESNADSARRASNSRYDAAKNDQLIAVLFGVTGVLAIGGAVVWYVIDTPSTTPAKKTSVTPLVGPSFAGLAIGGSL
jgi:hypothetical protein